MRVMVSCVPYDKGKSGISVYIDQLVKALEEQGHELTLIVEAEAAEHFAGRKLVVLPKWTSRAVFSMLYHLFILPFRLFGRKVDCCIIAAANRRCFAFYPLRTIAVVHDLSQYHVQAKYDAFRTFYIKRVLPFFVGRASRVVAISKSTAKDLQQYWHIPEEKISVVYNGLTVCGTSRPGWAAACNLKPKSYILYVSRLEHPGKNHVKLIQAFDALPEELRRGISLVLPGSDWSGSEEVHAAAKGAKASKDILLPGFVSQMDLEDAYTNALAYIFPSNFEGFGLSLIEAMHYGTPCAASCTSSLGEIGEGAALLFDPASVEEITRTLQQLICSPELREKLVQAGYARAKMFNWKNTAREIMACDPVIARLQSDR